MNNIVQENKTEYLYHYTSVDSLALILKHRTIRLNPLDKMDDLQEQETADLKRMVCVECDIGFASEAVCTEIFAHDHTSQYG